MTIPDSIIDAQLERLMQVVDDYRSGLHEQIISKSKQDKSLIVKSAYKDSRKRLHHNIQDIRKKIRKEISAASAKQGTLVQRLEYADNIRFLQQTWNVIEAKLLQRWRIAEQRKQWIEKIAHTVFNKLPPGIWQIEHPVDWLTIERNALSNYIHQRIGQKPIFVTDNSIMAGLRFNYSGAIIDGTLEGLLVDRARIESEMLAKAMDNRNLRAG